MNHTATAVTPDGLIITATCVESGQPPTIQLGSQPPIPLASHVQTLRVRQIGPNTYRIAFRAHDGQIRLFTVTNGHPSPVMIVGMGSCPECFALTESGQLVFLEWIAAGNVQLNRSGQRESTDRATTSTGIVDVYDDGRVVFSDDQFAAPVTTAGVAFVRYTTLGPWVIGTTSNVTTGVAAVNVTTGERLMPPEYLPTQWMVTGAILADNRPAIAISLPGRVWMPWELIPVTFVQPSVEPPVEPPVQPPVEPPTPPTPPTMPTPNTTIPTDFSWISPTTRYVPELIGSNLPAFPATILLGTCSLITDTLSTPFPASLLSSYPVGPSDDNGNPSAVIGNQLWIIKRDANWWIAPGEWLRPGQTSKVLPIHTDLYQGGAFGADTNRWGDLAGWTLTPGEVIGVAVSTPVRTGVTTITRARSGVVWLKAVGDKLIEVGRESVATPPPVEPPVTPPSVDIPALITALNDMLKTLDTTLAAVDTRLADLTTKLDATAEVTHALADRFVAFQTTDVAGLTAAINAPRTLTIGNRFLGTMKGELSGPTL